MSVETGPKPTGISDEFRKKMQEGMLHLGKKKGVASSNSESNDNKKGVSEEFKKKIREGRPPHLGPGESIGPKEEKIPPKIEIDKKEENVIERANQIPEKVLKTVEEYKQDSLSLADIALKTARGTGFAGRALLGFFLKPTAENKQLLDEIYKEENKDKNWGELVKIAEDNFIKEQKNIEENRNKDREAQFHLQTQKNLFEKVKKIISPYQEIVGDTSKIKKIEADFKKQQEDLQREDILISLNIENINKLNNDLSILSVEINQLTEETYTVMRSQIDAKQDPLKIYGIYREVGAKIGFDETKMPSDIKYFLNNNAKEAIIDDYLKKIDVDKLSLNKNIESKAELNSQAKNKISVDGKIAMKFLDPKITSFDQWIESMQKQTEIVIDEWPEYESKKKAFAQAKKEKNKLTQEKGSVFENFINELKKSIDNIKKDIEYNLTKLNMFANEFLGRQNKSPVLEKIQAGEESQIPDSGTKKMNITEQERLQKEQEIKINQAIIDIAHILEELTNKYSDEQHINYQQIINNDKDGRLENIVKLIDPEKDYKDYKEFILEHFDEIMKTIEDIKISKIKNKFENNIKNNYIAFIENDMFTNDVINENNERYIDSNILITLINEEQSPSNAINFIRQTKNRNLSKELAKELIKYDGAEGIINNIDKFDKFDSDVARALIGKNYHVDVAKNLNIFDKLDGDIAYQLINRGLALQIINDIDKFDFSKSNISKEIALNLIEQQPRCLAETMLNFDKFNIDDSDRKIISDELKDLGYNKCADYVNKNATINEVCIELLAKNRMGLNAINHNANKLNLNSLIPNYNEIKNNKDELLEAFKTLH